MTNTEKAAKCQQIIDLATEIRDATIGEPEPPPLTVEIEGPTEVQVGEKATFSVTQSSISFPPYKYIWDINGAATEVTFASDYSVTWDTIGTRWVSVTVIDSNGQSATDSIIVTVKGVPQPPVGTTINVGPNGAFATPDKVPWGNLQPNTVVNIVHRAQPYPSKLVLNRGNVTVKGIPATDGTIPVLTAQNAVENVDAIHPFDGAVKSGLITIVPPKKYDPPIKGVTIDGVATMNTRRDVPYTTKSGAKSSWWNAAAGISMYKAEDIVIQGCRLEENENGAFAGSSDDYGVCRNITIRHCQIRLNGVPGQTHYHGVYIEADGATYEFNEFDQVYGGALLKDRSAGAIVRYNRFYGSTRQLDLVEPDAGSATLTSSPKWGKTFAYGNLFRNIYEANVIHFGKDQFAPGKPGQVALFFYYNSLLTEGTFWKSNVFKTHGSEKLYLANNIFHSTAKVPTFGTPAAFGLFNNDGVNGEYWEMYNNFTTSGMQTKLDGSNPDVNGWLQSVKGSDPGYRADMTLTTSSICKGKAEPGFLQWYPFCPMVTHGWIGTKFVERTNLSAIGAAE